MKNKIVQIISTILMIAPWTILILRTQQWALELPTAQIMIGAYCILMIASGIFTLIGYNLLKIKNTLMKVCVTINSLYAVAGIGFLALMLFQ